MSSSENETDYSCSSDNEDITVSNVSTENVNKESESESESKDNTKQKLTVEQLLSDINKLQETLDTASSNYLDQVKEYESNRKQYNTDFKKNNKKLSSLLEKLPKLLAKELKCKTKRKTNGGKKGGILKEAPVPLRLRKYLDLNDNVLLTRPKVFSLLNTKFKEKGFKDPDNGKITIISKKTDANKLGVEKGYTFNIQQGQTFLKKFYDEEKEQLTASA